MGPERRTVTPDEALATIGGRLPGTWLIIWLVAIGLGVVGFVITVGEDPQRAWMGVWSNFLLWTAIAMAGVVFGAILSLAKGHWGKPFRRLAEAAGAFLPVSFLIFLLLRSGYEHVFPWTGEVETLHLNRSWLNESDVFLRNGVLLGILYLLALWFLRTSLRADAPLVAQHTTGWRRSFASLLSRNWRGDAEEVERSRHRLSILSPILVLSWAIVFSLFAYDFGMSLVPGFISMVWGPYYFVGGWLGLLALVAFMANRYNEHYAGEPLWDRWQFHDLGKLMFAFVVFWTYLWFAQFLVIWYGNLPREAVFFELRIETAFRWLFWLQMVLIFLLPFAFLLGRKPKMKPGWLAFVATLLLAGFWLERYNMVFPSIWHGEGVPLGLSEILISLGFLGLFSLCYGLYITTVPKVPVRETIAVGSASYGP